MLSTRRRTRYLKRYAQIATVLARHGLGWLAVQLGLGQKMPLPWEFPGRSKDLEQFTQAEHVRHALEELGPTFVKLGQILSTRPDLVPAEYIRELERLQDEATAVPFEQVSQIIERELGGHPDQIFVSFQREPLASASLGQVHRATLRDGRDVVVKVQRPGVRAQVELDIEILQDVVRRAARRLAISNYLDMMALADEFSYILRNELDYKQEGENADRIRTSFEDDPNLHVPCVHWDLTTSSVLTMEEIEGIKITDVPALQQCGYDPRQIARIATRIMLTMVFRNGFFHADPHPGNFYVMPGPRLGLMDFGMAARLDDAARESLMRLLMGMLQQDPDRVVDEMLALNYSHHRVRRHALKRDVDHFIESYSRRSIKEAVAGHMFNDLMRLALKHKIQFPANMTTLFKVVAMSEGVASTLDPAFRLGDYARPYIQEFWLERWLPSNQIKRLSGTMMDMADLSSNLPRKVQRLLTQMEKGDVRVTTHLEDADDLLKGFERLANRLAMSILTAALIIGVGLLLQIYSPPEWGRYGGWAFNILFIAAALFGLRLLWTIWRSGKH